MTRSKMAVMNHASEQGTTRQAPRRSKSCEGVFRESVPKGPRSGRVFRTSGLLRLTQLSFSNHPVRNEHARRSPHALRPRNPSRVKPPRSKALRRVRGCNAVAPVCGAPRLDAASLSSLPWWCQTREQSQSRLSFSKSKAVSSLRTPRASRLVFRPGLRLPKEA